jgi:hypothetical protein
LEGLADEVAKRLAHLIDVEFKGLDEHELESATLCVGESIDTAGLSLELMVRADLDPAELERHVRENSKRVMDKYHLSEARTGIFSLILTESCNYAVEIATTLPAFGTAAAIQILRKETEIIDLVQTVLARLPQRGIQDAADLDARFETQYRRDVARRLDYLELFGVDVSPLSRRYALTVAYITLSSSYKNPAGKAVQSRMVSGRESRLEHA